MVIVPVARTQVGCIVVVAVAAAGGVGVALISTAAEDTEVQPTEFVTVKVYDPAANPEMVALVPVLVVVTGPGVLVKVHVPVAGKPFKTTLPVTTAHVG